MKDLVGLVYNVKIPEARDFVHKLVGSLGLGDRCWASEASTISKHVKKLGETSVIVVVGGDGTILRTVRETAPFSIPLVGVNMGRVGFMTELTVEETVEQLPLYLQGAMRVEERMMLTASVGSASGDGPRVIHHALNDVVVGRTFGRLQDIKTSVDGAPLTTYRADAVIVSTPTGSTGYAVSAGGPIINPEAKVMLVQPVAVHTGLKAALILEEHSVVELLPSDSEKSTLIIDGFADIELVKGEIVRIQRSSYVARFLRANSSSYFYSTLTQRLGMFYRSA